MTEKNAQPQPAPQQAPQQGKGGKQRKRAKAERTPAELVRQRAYVTAASVLVAVVAVGYGIFATLDANGRIEEAQANAMPTVVAAAHIPKGHVIEADDLVVRDVPQALRAADALGSADLSGESSIIGSVAVTDISANSQMTRALAAGAGSTVSLADALSPGMEAVTISVNAEAGMAGNFVVGDIVRVVSMMGAVGGNGSAVDIAPDARIIALDTALSGQSSYSSVTVEVTPDQAALIRGAQASSGVSFILTAAADGESR